MKCYLYFSILFFLFGCGDKLALKNVPIPRVPILGEVVPTYSNFTNFLDFIRTADTTSSCNAAVDDSYDECLLAGLQRKIEVTGESTCGGLTITDTLGVFDWSCSVISGVATFSISDFKSGKGLKDLLNESSFKNNSVRVYSSGVWIMYSNSEVWWTDTVAPLAGQTTLATAGIYTVASSGVSDTITVASANVGIVTLSGTTLTYNTGTKNIAGLGVTATLIYSAQNFNYFELNLVPYNSGSTTHAVGIVDLGHFARVHNTTMTSAFLGLALGGNANIISGTTSITDSTYLSFALNAGDRSYVKGTMTLANLTTAGGATLGLNGGTTNNVFDADVSVAGKNFSIVGNSSNNTFNGDISISNSTSASGLNISSGANNTFNGDVTVDTVTGNNNNIMILSANNTFNGNITIKNNAIGFAMRVDTAGNVFNGAVLVEDTNQGIWLNGSSGGMNNNFVGAITINRTTNYSLNLDNTANNSFGAVTIDGGGVNTTALAYFNNADLNTFSGAFTLRNADQGILLEAGSGNNTINSSINISSMAVGGIYIENGSNDNLLSNITTTSCTNDVIIDSMGGTNPQNNVVTKVGHPGPQFTACGGDSLVGFSNTTSCP